MCVCVCVCVTYLAPMPFPLSLSLSDNIPAELSDSANQAFSMSGDSMSGDIHIPSVFMLRDDAERLRQLLASGSEEVFVLLTWIRREGGGEGEGEGEETVEDEGTSGSDGGQSSIYDSGEWTDDRTEWNQDMTTSSPSHTSSDNNNSSH